MPLRNALNHEEAFTANIVHCGQDCGFVRGVIKVQWDAETHTNCELCCIVLCCAVTFAVPGVLFADVSVFPCSGGCGERVGKDHPNDT